ncbi:conserved Plasmodium protein, unknown function [Plasmodium berghei]|uniref:Uncharacterized protein n=2 Tax=Plasmodium berghei TaxID=5821 RepID=A0A509AG04_PLABA|nr:conserved Plasmodium protein, unknown function [Plasmodium berghei ANKA]CXI07743.1 conserved Plasmodium protein, unknown function [Plasmodium berghei]SCL92642.1 conserved Plasmodium protein, unknown function [Plasmodium berghei]SCM15684.1 conserved Plasmodium protein, unknown function [Plasmodium berghei]SCN22850.1 conserved Plasmodium protein, unknown function [Plasmodium berghei]VUC54460.1 conserved Plasmodium protein, unknown function [Plasmodium berghei ANKA]|eukprot:XP_034420289.1 conserved Plasmodium protein, unknown function [Plasmodium berghei ANKA]
MNNRMSKKKNNISESVKETKEERVLKRFEENKIKWENNSKILMKKTNKKDTLADQGEKYREKNELNTLLEYLKKEDETKVQWIKNLRMEPKKIKFKKTTKKLNIYNNTSKENKQNIFDKILEKKHQCEGKETNNENYVYVTNRDVKKEEYQNIVVNKIKNNLEFFLSNFAIPLFDNLYVQGKPIEHENESNCEDFETNKLSSKEIKCLNVLEKETSPLDQDKSQQAYSIKHENINKTTSHDEIIKVNCSYINIENNGKDIVNKFIFLQNITSSIIIYIIYLKNKMKIKNDVLYFDKKKNYNLFIYPKTGYIKPGETIKINLNFIFDYFAYSFGFIQIKYFYKNKIFKKKIFISINPLFDILDTFTKNGKITDNDKIKTKKLIKKYNNFKISNIDSVTQNKTYFPNKQKLENMIKCIYSDYNININNFENLLKKKNEGLKHIFKIITKTQVHTNKSNIIHDKIISSNICQSDLKNIMNVFFYYIKNKILQYTKESCSNNQIPFLNFNTNDYVNLESKIFNYKLETILKEVNEMEKVEIPFNLYKNGIYKNSEIFYETLYNYIYHLIYFHQTEECINKNTDFGILFTNKYDKANLEYFTKTSKLQDVHFPSNVNARVFKKWGKEIKESEKNAINKTFESMLLHARIENYFKCFMNHIYFQNKLNNSHIYYFYNYFKIIKLINQYFILDKNSFYSKSPKQNVFIYMNPSLYNIIFLYVLEKLGSDFFSENDSNILNNFNLFYESKIKDIINKLTELFWEYFLSIILSIKDGAENIYAYFGEVKKIEGKNNFFNLFLILYLKGFISKISKKQYNIQILENKNDVIEYVNNKFRETDTCQYKFKNREEDVSKKDDQTGVDKNENDKKLNNEIAYKNLDLLFEYNEIYNEICNSICEYKNNVNSNDLENNQSIMFKGSILFLKDKIMFSQIVYETNRNKIQISIENNLEKLKEVKENEQTKIDINNNFNDKKSEHDKTKKSKKNKSPEKKKTHIQPNENKPNHIEFNFTNFHFFKMFEILNIDTCIIDDKKILKKSEMQCNHFYSNVFTWLKKQIPKNVEINLGSIMKKEMYILLYILNIISIDHINFLFNHFKNSNILLYIEYLKSNANYFLDIFRNILQFFSMKNYLSKFIFEKNIPLSIHYDHFLINNMELETDKKNETLNFSKEIYKKIRENWEINRIKNKTNIDAKYICIISPNIKNKILNFTNINEILEWIKLLNIIIFLNISDVYISGDLFLLFLFFIYDSDILKGYIPKPNDETSTLFIYPNKVIQTNTNKNEEIENVYFKIIDTYNIPENILFLFKFCIFNIIKQYEKYKINIHFPYDIYVNFNFDIFQNKKSTLYCLLPYTNYSIMIKYAKKNFIKKYSEDINKTMQNILKDNLKNTLINSNSNTNKNLLNGIFNDPNILKYQKFLNQQNCQNSKGTKNDKPEKLATSILNIGIISINNILKNINKQNKILWLCGSFEKYINDDNKNSMQIFNHILNISKDEQNNFINIHKGIPFELYANNLLILNKQIYYLYIYHAPKELRLNFVFNNYHILTNIFDHYCYFTFQKCE